MSRQLGLQLDPIMNPGGVQFPVKRGTWDFIELAWNTGIAQSIISQIGNSYSSGVVYILFGCQLSSSGGNTTIQPGCIFLNGEYFISRNVITFPNPTGGNVVVTNLVSTSWQPTDAAGDQYADPVGFIGASSADVHIDRTCTFASGASGSGTLTGSSVSDYSNLVSSYNQYTFSGLSLQTGWSNVGSRYPASFKIIDGNLCILSGTIIFNTTISGSRNVLQLPFTISETIGNRPCFIDNGSGFDIFYLNVNTSGMININGITASSSPILNLEGIIIRIS